MSRDFRRLVQGSGKTDKEFKAADVKCPGKHSRLSVEILENLYPRSKGKMKQDNPNKIKVICMYPLLPNKDLNHLRRKVTPSRLSIIFNAINIQSPASNQKYEAC